jgi:predicted dehydrogenase
VGLNAPQIVEAAEYCRKKGIPVMEALMYKLHPQWTRSAEIVKSRELGTVISTNSVFSYDNQNPKDIRNQVATGGGGLLDIGCYTISTARFLMEAEPERVVCNLVRDPVFKTDIFASGLLDFGNGRTSTFTVGTQFYPYQRVTAFGTGGTLSVEVPFNMYGDYPGHVTVITGIGERVISTDIADQYRIEFDSFAEAIINKTGVPTPISDGIANMAVLDALFSSAASGTWEPVKRY